MGQQKTYENYPFLTIIISNLISFAIYLSGAFIISQIGPFWLALYLFYILGLEIKVLKSSCVNCYYYGKLCSFGKGKISSCLFKKGNPRNFKKRSITWKDVLPDFLVSIIPLIAGIALLILNFNWLIFASIIALVILNSSGNAFVRGSMACKFCKQREIGCPSEKLFNKKGK